jgi:hypothetical protein
MSTESIYSDELILLAETLGEVKTRTEKLEGEFSTHAKPLEAATNALSAALSGIKALQFHVLDNNLGALSARVEEMRKAVDEQVGVIALELKKADETNAAKAGADAEALRSEIVALQSQLGSLVTQFGQQLERVEFAAKEEAQKLQLIPGPAGAAGASLNPRGTFIDGETYNRLDVVSWLGSSYIATVDGVKEKPSKNSNQWQTLASRGGGGAGGVGDFGSLAGVAQINQGGTGQTTRVAALNALLPDQAGATQYILLTDGSGTVSWGAQPVAGLPSQTSNSGRLLTTNGTTASWSNAVTVSGSNATVGGTLTVNGDVFVSTGGKAIYSQGYVTVKDVQANLLSRGTYLGWTTGLHFYSSNTDYSATLVHQPGNGDLQIYTNATTSNYTSSDIALQITTAKQVQVKATTASTSTSSGALVVGNGTSGGLGVGGNIYAGGDVFVVKADPSSTLTRTANTNNALFQLTTGATYDFAFGLRNTTDSDFHLYNYGTSADALKIARSSSVVSVLSSTASTSTSSGALVVSGGVGVAGAVFSGGYVHPGGDSNFYIRGTGSSNGLITGAIVSVDTSANFRVRNAAGSSTYLDVDSSNVTISSGVGLKLGNAYVAGAPTATGYIVIKDSTGTSYKIPAVAL